MSIDYKGISPSSFSRLIFCPASHQLSKKVPKREELKEASEGTGAAKLLETVLNARYVKGDTSLTTYKYLGRVMEGIAVTPEMASYIQDVVDYVDKVSEGGAFKVMPEAKCKMKFPGIRKIFRGTADVFVYDPISLTLTVIDLKYGAGIPVTAYQNKQLMGYALGFIQTYNQYEIEQVDLVIHQPRLEGVTTWAGNSIESINKFAEEMAEAIRSSVSETPTLAVYPEADGACVFCTGKLVCPHYTKQIEDNLPFALNMRGIDELTEEEIGKRLDQLSLISKYKSMLQAVASGVLNAGGEVPGWQMTDGRKTRKFTSYAEVEARIKDACAGDEKVLKAVLYKPEEFKSVAQVEKALKTNKIKVDIEDIVEVTRSKGSLKPIGDAGGRVGEQKSDRKFKESDIDMSLIPNSKEDASAGSCDECAVPSDVIDFGDSTDVIDFGDSTDVIDFGDSSDVIDFGDSTDVIDFGDSTDVIDFG